ncbi:MRPS11 isoform 2 [Pongo abelii]|uniref:MRPS11 isoform 2 n=1 Tax=Pongo abelii TaxID=9601 RepID=A0A2J8VWV8_PONAB|nr:MRPS11 isoform 2 [Pongo abelii]
MQAVRNVGSWFLRSWTWTQTTGRVVARTPAGTIHTGARQLQDAAAKQKVEVKAAPSHTKFSIYPPIPGEENSLRWAGKKFEEIPIAHIKASHNKGISECQEGHRRRSTDSRHSRSSES